MRVEDQRACELPGVPVISDLNPDGSDNDMAPNQPIDGSVNIRQLYVAEPFVGGGVNKLVFTLQDAPSTTGAAPPNSQWYIIWNRHNPTVDFDRLYVAMKTDVSGATSFRIRKLRCRSRSDESESKREHAGESWRCR